jgi:DNA repair protein RadD
MEFEFRQYQEDCENAMLKYALDMKGYNPVVAVPTGGGKTKILSSFIYKYLEREPTHNILVLSHTETIIKQDYAAIQSFFPGIIIGLYSSGLGSKTVQKITIAGIQSVYKKPELFQQFHVVIVDECHTVPTKGNGMYRQFFKSIDVVRVGLSGSPFRTGHGYVHTGKGALFNVLAYNLCSMDNFNKLVADGYLTKLISKPPDYQMNTDGVKESAGDYNVKDLSRHFDRQELTDRAVEELVKFGKNYKSWLVFAIDIDHADHINEQLLKHGINSEVLHSRSDTDRHELKDQFVNKEIRAIVSVGMITTGFDAPNIDLLVLLRPTKSPVLHVQMIGRGLRICEGKTHCLVLDFAGNISRLGPINNVEIPTAGKKKNGNGKPVVKKCPVCGCLHHPIVKFCDVCGHEFQFNTNIKSEFDTKDVVQTTSDKRWFQITDVMYSKHDKPGKPTSLKVIYKSGLFTVTEYVCYDHPGYAGYKGQHWVKTRWNGNSPLPRDVDELYKGIDNLIVPAKILIDLHSKYPSVLDVEFRK